jgi:hypothetical protein
MSSKTSKQAVSESDPAILAITISVSRPFGSEQNEVNADSYSSHVLIWCKNTPMHSTHVNTVSIGNRGS